MYKAIDQLQHQDKEVRDEIVTQKTQSLKSSVIVWLSRDRIVSTLAERIAPQHSPNGKSKSFQRTMLGDGLHSVIGTRGCKTACRPRIWRNSPLVKPDK
jgi:hypothetical protein